MLSRRYRLKASHALTLLELVVTFMIIAILAAIALPSYQGATQNTALLRDEAMLVNLATVSQSVSLEAGSSVPNSNDFIKALASSDYQPNTNTLVTNATSIVTDPPTGVEVASTSPGQVSVYSGSETTNANGKVIPIAGAAMLTNNGSCIMVSITPSKTQSYAFPYNAADPIDCSGESATNGGTGGTGGTGGGNNPGVLPDAPTVTIPAGTTLPDITANWTSLPDVYEYNVDLYSGTTEIESTTINQSSNPTYTFAGLSLPTYTVEVAGVNSTGTGPYGEATWTEIPGAPTDVVGTPVTGTNTATITWDPPLSPTGTPASYTVTTTDTTTPANGGQTCTFDVGPTPTDTCTVTGLTPGDTYTATVTATNPAGTGPASNPSAPFSIVSVPGIPNAPVATLISGTTSATISWCSPTDDTGGCTPYDPGSSAVDGYTVVSPELGDVCVTTTATTCTVTGLVGGTSYTFAVSATNATGYGLQSPQSNAIDPATVPNPPTGVTATGANASATVTWTAPTNTGGLPLAGYTVTSSSGQTCTTTGATTCTVYGLTNGTSYTFTVVATNSVGNSAPSAPSNAVVPAGPPTAPLSPVATCTGTGGSCAGSTTATITWTAPSNDGLGSSTGANIESYEVTDSSSVTGEGGQTCTVVTQVNAPTTCTITGLSFGSTYTFVVVATNTAGLTSPASSASNPITPYTYPNPPTGVTAANGDTNPGSTNVSWTAPVNNGGSAITGYTVTATTGSTTAGTCTTTSLACTITGLNNGTTYTITVIATNAGGNSAPGTAFVTPSWIPGAPTSLTTSGTTNTDAATTAWTAPNSNGSAITGYVVKYSYTESAGALSGTITTVSPSPTTTSSPYVPTNQALAVCQSGSGSYNAATCTTDSETTYYVETAATNANGTGPYSAPETVNWDQTGEYATTVYTCNPGDTLSGTTCTDVATTPATNQTTYSCSSGYTVSGSNCVQSISTPATASTYYSCPSGDSLSGTSCSGTSTIPATATSTSSGQFVCAGGWQTPNPQQGYCTRVSTYPTQQSCINNNSYASDYWNANQGICYLYYPNTKAPQGSPCNPPGTTSGCTNPPWVVTTTTTYSCPNGYRLSGESCTYTGTTNATPVTTYSCPSGGTLSGSSCITTSTTSATPTSGYTCPNGYTLSGTTCSKTTTYAANDGGTCPSGGTEGGQTCTVTSSATPPYNPTYSCPSGGSLSGSTCIVGSNYAASEEYNGTYSCPSGGTLSGSTCTITTTYTGTNEPYYTCPSGWSANNSGSTYSSNGCYRILTGSSQANCTNNGGEWLGGGDCELFTANQENNDYVCNVGDSGGGSSSTCTNTSSYAATEGESYYCPSGGSLSGSTCYNTTTYSATQTGFTCTGTGPGGGTYTSNGTSCYETYAASPNPTETYYYAFGP